MRKRNALLSLTALVLLAGLSAAIHLAKQGILCEFISAQPSERAQSVLAEAMAASLVPRELLLKLLSVNLYDMEENSRPERLVSFKRAYRDSVEVVRVLLGAACPEETEEQIQDLILALFPFIHGIYPYAFHTEKQRQAMEQAGISLEERSIYDLALGAF